MNYANTFIISRIWIFSTSDTVTPNDPEPTVSTCSNYRLFATSTMMHSSSICTL